MSAQLNNVIELLNRWGEIHWNFAAAMFLQVSVLIVVLLCLDLTILRRLRASVRYSLWMLVLVKLMLPVTLHTPISVSRWMPDLQPRVEVAEPSRAEPVVEAVSRPVLEPVPAPIEPRRLPSTPPGAEMPPPSIAGNLHDADVGDVPSTSAPPPVIFEKPETKQTSRAAIPLRHLNWQAYVLLAWMAAVLTLSVTFVRRTWLVRRIVAASIAAPQELEPILSECLQMTKVSGKRVALRISDALGSPAICGFRRGTILLPSTLLEKLDRQQLRSILVHELVHWRRCDLQVNCLQTLILIVYFYNPLVWVANVILRRAREQAVDEAVLATLDSPAEDYSTTLLNIASLSRRPAELTLRMVGVVESRKALSGRIKRILSRPIPRTARLGFTGLAAVLIAGFVLLPMGGSSERTAIAQNQPVRANEKEKLSDEDRAEQLAREEKEAAAKTAPSQIVLTGQVEDDRGNPVTDAELTIIPARGGRRITGKTDETGFYLIDNFPAAGTYALWITSQRWVGIPDQERVTLSLSAGDPNIRNLTLKRACQVRIRTVDEQGRPVRKVRLMANNLAAESHIAPETVRTDEQGIVILGGLAPSESEYLIATMDERYAFEKLVLTLNDPEQILEKEIVMRRGKTIQGTAICSDGKPPAGWRISVLPSWWHFGRSFTGSVIAEDGSFELSHIVPGKYNVSISIPRDDGFSSSFRVLNETELSETDGLLQVKMDYPSPASLVSIEGRVKRVGPVQNSGFWIHAESKDPFRSVGTFLRPGQTAFKIGPLPKGTYELDIDPDGLTVEPGTITAPADDVELVVTSDDQPQQFTGTVIDARTKAPVTRFRLRVIKQRYASEPGYFLDSLWRTFENDEGRFECEVDGPGIYRVFVAADGYAWQLSESINTVEQTGQPLQVALSHGVTLTGTVVNERGDPVDGATVFPLSKYAGFQPQLSQHFAIEDGAVKSVNGRFELPHLLPGTDSLKVDHPDYCFTTVPVVVDPEGHQPVRVTLPDGGTVRGRVLDAEGKPEPKVVLYFSENMSYRGDFENEDGRYAMAVTDANGFFEVHHLPEQLCYVVRNREWEWRLGVVRHCILPQNGRTLTLNFGGERTVSGRLLVNGVPFADQRVLLSGNHPNGGTFKALAQTKQDGSFVFRGVPLGERTLYHELSGRRPQWSRVRTIQVTDDSTELGTIDHLSGRLEVRIEPAAVTENPDMTLWFPRYDPILTNYDSVASVKRVGTSNVFQVEPVPVGEYELVCTRPGQFEVRKQVEVTTDTLQQQLTLQIPSGTATLSGRIDEGVRGTGGYFSLNMETRNQELRGFIRPGSDGTFRLENIPAGEYVFRTGFRKDSSVIREISLDDGAQQTLDFTPENIRPGSLPRGWLIVNPYTSNGIPLPCHPYLEGPDGKLIADYLQLGSLSFTWKPGTYTLVAEYPGFETIRRSVELKPVTKGGRLADGCRINVFLKPAN